MRLDLFERHLRHGELVIVLPNGQSHRFGAGEPRATWILKQPEALPRILAHPAFELGQTYMEGGWDAGDGDLLGLLRLLRHNLAPEALRPRPLARLACILQSWNHLRVSLRNVTRHYDLDESLFRAFLDRDLQYSCGYFSHPGETLESAQIAKCRHIAAKLALRPGQRVLDIGSGWGGLAFHLAAYHDVAITGLTLSKEQFRVATAEAERRKLSDRVLFRLEDYRRHRGCYDRIVSVGMFEHVGRRYFQTFFAKVSRLLDPAGVAVLHTIGSTAPPAPTNPWMRRYIFPGGYIPSLSEVAAAIEGSQLIATDLEILRDHYAFTLAEWNRRFQARRTEHVNRLGDAFCRMWEFYLASSQTAFETRELVVQQWQLAQTGTDLPNTRDYLLADRGVLPERGGRADQSEIIALDDLCRNWLHVLREQAAGLEAAPEPALR